ncbi:MAG: PhzF family phenazine biosynthesis protein [Piscinibacter sp.]|uniref:PhzF family phenazine biosynthesis protein n=1 Tax=Piscinibacter sp. TaxID=1903157 RepID=UPI001B40E701|nr:PhzF family phenazine biosynthesis protein [Piscinibacter sp.]MBP5990062.1 PhzF family phenazine biosynthesis protein [Piscinibacter sp.]MBP6027545.1 PhzF family phenazine biosynthesis protein [Piscinibacter sp.]
MSTTRRFTQLDVFTAEPLKGNPLAVVHDAQGLSDAQMAAFARWTNLSETTFLLPPTQAGADYRVRIFTPDRELPFAGHPTLGSCHAWLAAGGRAQREGEVVQECGVGLVRVRRDGTRLAFAAPPLRRSGEVDAATLAQIARCLKIPRDAIRASNWVSNGPHWVAVMLGSREELLALQPDFAAMGELELGVVAPWPGGAADVEVRAFVPTLGVQEDPVTGSLNAGLAQWLIAAGMMPPRYVASQGTAMGRAGRVHVEQRDGDIWIGGDSVALVEGRVSL